MYIIIKKRKAEGFSSKLRKIKDTICDIMEDIEYAAEKEYEEEELFRHEHSRHEGRRRDDDRRRHEDDYDDYDREYSRGGGRGGMRASRGRY